MYYRTIGVKYYVKENSVRYFDFKSGTFSVNNRYTMHTPHYYTYGYTGLLGRYYY